MSSAADLRRRLAAAAGLSFDEWVALGRAMAELALARVRLTTFDRGGAATAPDGPDRPRQAAAVARVERALERASRLVPWRSDCLVQALAARRWLGRLGIEGDIVLGARAAGRGQLDAHAWLDCGRHGSVGGGDRGYRPLARLPRS